ncbi:synaptobrevin-like [Drosophila eugracilis]|uniref:synaptobrevin-like n=1 Tax=Drosophila eugracilis TaxID=29029 RepID=UPI0007E7D48D|nr:synaptobrevin-like [Drosophila eugracilis]
MDSDSEFEMELKDLRAQGEVESLTDVQKKLLDTQSQVDEVVGIMRVNVEKVLERDQALSELTERADQLEQGASQFVRQSGRLKRKHWLANAKMMLILAVIVAVLVAILLVFIWPREGSKATESTLLKDQKGD